MTFFSILVRDVVHQSRISAILFPLHPARMFHTLIFMFGGSVSAYNIFGMRSEEVFYFTRFSEKYVLIIEYKSYLYFFCLF